MNVLRVQRQKGTLEKTISVFGTSEETRNTATIQWIWHEEWKQTCSFVPQITAEKSWCGRLWTKSGASCMLIQSFVTVRNVHWDWYKHHLPFPPCHPYCEYFTGTDGSNPFGRGAVIHPYSVDEEGGTFVDILLYIKLNCERTRSLLYVKPWFSIEIFLGDCSARLAKLPLFLPPDNALRLLAVGIVGGVCLTVLDFCPPGVCVSVFVIHWLSGILQ